MRMRGAILPGAGRLQRRVADLSPEARQRLGWIEWHHGHGSNARKTCRHCTISPDTLYRWLRRYQPHDLSSLENRSRRPKRLRQHTWNPDLEREVLHLREQFPRWGKDKLVVLLHRQGYEVSTSMVGRILTRLKRQGILKEPSLNGISARRRQLQRPYAVRKPKEYTAKEPGALVQLDTMDVRPLPGVVLKHFTARDTVSRWDVIEVHTQARATTAARFLDTMVSRMPFPIRAIQVDGGSEFQAEFETTCLKRDIRLFVLPPRSPKLNGSVERAQRTHTEEFYELYDGDLEIAPLNHALKQWEYTYNYIRPHQTLGQLTPNEYLARSCHHSPSNPAGVVS